MAKISKHYLLPSLSGLLMALAYPGWSTGWWIDLGWLVWFGLISLFSAIEEASLEYGHERIKRSVFLWRSFFIGMTAGLVYFLIIFRWFWSIYPLDTLGIDNRLISFFVVLFVYLISSSGMAIFWGLFGLVLSSWFLVFSKKSENYKPQNTNHKILLLTPALFVLFEYLRSWGFGFLWAGSGSLFGSHWTLGNLAYSLADNYAALRVAPYVGIYGITFIIILVNCLIFYIARHNRAKTYSTKILLLISIIVAVFLGPKLLKSAATQETNGKKINFALIQTAQPTKTNPDPQEALTYFKAQLELLDRVAKEHSESQLIVFPETSELLKNLALFLPATQVQKYFNDLFREPELIIAGNRITDTNGTHSRIFYLDTKNGIINYYDKRLLTPGGEFLPYPIKLITWLLAKNTMNKFNNLREFSVGIKNISAINFRNQFNVAALICSELLSPDITRQTSQNSDVIAGMASYGIFHGNPVIAKQMLTASRFRAAENNKPILTAANLGSSYAIDSRGNIVLLASNKSQQILTGTIVTSSNKTWYNKVGDLPIILVSLLLVVGAHSKILFVAKFLILKRDKEDE